jgi:hypothetical protein
MSYELDALEAGGLEGGPSDPTRLAESLAAPLRHELSRLGSGLGLAAVYGLALGARTGGVDLIRHALGAPLGVMVVALVTAPSLFVRLALIDAPLRPAQMLAAVAQGAYTTGLTLAGLAPAAAMLVVSIESAPAAAWMSGLGLWLAGGIGLFNLCAALKPGLVGTDLRLQSRALFALAVFSALSCALTARVWGAWLPVLGGGS